MFGICIGGFWGVKYGAIWMWWILITQLGTDYWDGEQANVYNFCIYTCARVLWMVKLCVQKYVERD